MNPKGLWQLLQTSVQTVPVMKYAVGAVGVAAAVGLIAALGMPTVVVVFGAILVLGAMMLIVVAENTARQPTSLALAGILLTWCFVVLVILSATLLFTSFFFGYPLNWK